MTIHRQLQVRIDRTVIGTLATQNDIWRFTYARDWQDAPNSFALAPSLPLAAQEYIDGADLRPVQWYFDNLLPEENLRSVLAKEARIDDADAFGLLTYYGGESAGSLTLTAPDGPPAPIGVVPLPLPELDARIRDLPRATLMQAAPKRMSLAGAQHKMVVCVQGDALFEPLPGSSSTHILKPDNQSEDYPHSVINEYFTMRLAGAVGLNVPAVRRLYTPAPVYIVQRFDRTVESDGQVRRLHIIDTCQLLNKSRAFKYEQATLATLTQAALLCTARALTRLHLYRWVLFNYFIGNGDNHLKNLSFHISHGDIRLAPAYDLLSTSVYDTRAFRSDPVWPRTQLALSLGDATRFDRVDRTTLLRTGHELGLTPAIAQRELDKMVGDIPMHADQLLQEVEAEYPALLANSPAPDQAALHQAGELRLLRAIRHVVLPDTLRSARE